MKAFQLLGFIMLSCIMMICELKSQLDFVDVDENQLSTLSLQLQDSLYEPNTITVWFKRNVINQEYLCNYWKYYHSTFLKKKTKDILLTSNPTGCFNINPQLIKDSNIVQTLISLGANRMCQYTMFSPCVDTISITRNGDTLRTPEYWNCFYISLNNNNAALAVQTLTLFYGGTKIEYAELNPKGTQDDIINDTMTLETYCYEVWDKNTNKYLGWYPTTPHNVVYRYTIWGLGNPSDVKNSDLYFTHNYIEVRCETRNLLGNNTLLVHYFMKEPGPVNVYIYDILGNLIKEKSRDVWSNEPEQTMSFDMENVTNGVYFVVVKDKSTSGFGKFIIFR